jgi:hypothetical protein
LKSAIAAIVRVSCDAAVLGMQPFHHLSDYPLRPRGAAL